MLANGSRLFRFATASSTVDVAIAKTANVFAANAMEFVGQRVVLVHHVL